MSDRPPTARPPLDTLPPCAACNPWIILVPAAGLYLAALLATPSTLGAPYYVNGSLVLMQVALVGTSRLIATNLVTLKSETHFLVQLGSIMGIEAAQDMSDDEQGGPHSRFRVGGGVLRGSQAGGYGGAAAPAQPHLAEQQSFSMGPSLASGQAVGATGLPLPPLNPQAGQHTAPQGWGRGGGSASSDGLGGGQEEAFERKHSTSSQDSSHHRLGAGTLGAEGLDALPHSPQLPMRGTWAHTPAHQHKYSHSTDSSRAERSSRAPPDGGFKRYRQGARLARYGSSTRDLDRPALHSMEEPKSMQGGVATRVAAIPRHAPPPPQRSPKPPPPSDPAEPPSRGKQVSFRGVAAHSRSSAAPAVATPASLGTALAVSSDEHSDDSSLSASSGDDASPGSGPGAAARRGLQSWQEGGGARSAPVTPGRANALRAVRSLRLAPGGGLGGGSLGGERASQRQLDFYRAAGARGRSGDALRIATR